VELGAEHDLERAPRELRIGEAAERPQQTTLLGAIARGLRGREIREEAGFRAPVRGDIERTVDEIVGDAPAIAHPAIDQHLGLAPERARLVDARDPRHQLDPELVDVVAVTGPAVPAEAPRGGTEHLDVPAARAVPELVLVRVVAEPGGTSRPARDLRIRIGH